MRIGRKKIPTSVEEAITFARERFPEKYKDIDLKGFAMSQRIDVNAAKRMSYARSLIRKAGLDKEGA